MAGAFLAGFSGHGRLSIVEPLTLVLVGVAAYLAYRATRPAPRPTPEAMTPPSGPSLPVDVKQSLMPSTAAEWPADWVSIPGGVTVPWSEVLGAAGVTATRSLPKGFAIRIAGGADAPIVHHERVMFDVVDTTSGASKFRGTLEGMWEGPTSPDAGPGVVVVDRVVDAGPDGKSLPFGRYVIPASAKSGYHDRLERPSWYAIRPEDGKLTSLMASGSMSAGLLATLPRGTVMTAALRDTHGNIVAAVVEVMSNGGSPYMVKPLRVYRVLVDEGSGPVVFTKNNAQLIKMDASHIVDPKSLL